MTVPTPNDKGATLDALASDPLLAALLDGLNLAATPGTSWELAHNDERTAYSVTHADGPTDLVTMTKVCMAVGSAFFRSVPAGTGWTLDVDDDGVTFHQVDLDALAGEGVTP